MLYTRALSCNTGISIKLSNDMTKFYRLGDRVPLVDRQALGAEDLSGFALSWEDDKKQGRFIKAELVGEFRAPRAGEWYLSGTIPEAYRAPNDLSAEYHIMRLVLIERKTVITERRI